MGKYLHFLFFLLVLLMPFFVLKAQDNRIKSAKIIQDSVIQTTPDVISKPAQTDAAKVDGTVSVPEFRSNSNMTAKVKDSIPGKHNKVKPEIKAPEADIPSSDRLYLQDNVTYEKETLPETEINTVSEKKKIKVNPSVNYSPKAIQEDIHPAASYSNDISDKKRMYLQQEADDLDREIRLNAGKAGYDVAAKQKQLDDIKRMLQK